MSFGIPQSNPDMKIRRSGLYAGSWLRIIPSINHLLTVPIYLQHCSCLHCLNGYSGKNFIEITHSKHCIIIIVINIVIIYLFIYLLFIYYLLLIIYLLIINLLIIN